LNMLDCIEDNIKREVKEVGWEGVDWINRIDSVDMLQTG
jgi:hypothetical protein